MRHYNIPRLEGTSYYVVFCDCGRELKRFYDKPNQTGAQQFEAWFSKTKPNEQCCSECCQKMPPETQLSEKEEPSTITSFVDGLKATYETVLADIDPQKASLDTKRETAKQLSHIAATACAALALQPIPIADVLVLTPIQILLVQAIGRVYGVPISKKTALEVATNIGLGIVLQQIFIALVKTGIPLMGGLLVSTYVYTATFYMGKMAQIYFEKGRPLTQQELQQVQTTRSRAEERLRELDHLKQQGLISEEEYKNKRNRILDEL